MRIHGAVMLGLLAFAGCEPKTTTTQRTEETTTVEKTVTPAPAKDNTAVNERDRNAANKTPLDQDENQADVTTTAEIRKRIVATPDMSINGQNVKVITSQGHVTLRGPVANEHERDAIASIAHDIAGKDKVDNQLEVAP